MEKKKKAFSLVELILIVLFVGAFTTIAIPRLNFAAISRKKVDIAAKKIVTDFRRTRLLAIANAAQNTAGFAIVFSGSNYEIENLDTHVVVDSISIDSEVTCSGPAQFNFGPLGNLLGGSDTSIDVSGNGKSYTISVVSATGTAKCTEN